MIVKTPGSQIQMGSLEMDESALWGKIPQGKSTVPLWYKIWIFEKIRIVYHKGNATRRPWQRVEREDLAPLFGQRSSFVFVMGRTVLLQHESWRRRVAVLALSLQITCVCAFLAPRLHSISASACC